MASTDVASTAVVAHGRPAAHPRVDGGASPFSLSRPGPRMDDPTPSRDDSLLCPHAGWGGIWHASGLLLVTLAVPRALLGSWLPDLAVETLPLALSTGVGYGLALALLSPFAGDRPDPERGLVSGFVRTALGTGAAVVAGFGVAAVLLEWGIGLPYYRSVVLLAGGATFGLLVLARTLPAPGMRVGSLVLAVAAVAATGASLGGGGDDDDGVVHQITGLHGIRLDRFEVLPESERHGGGGMESVAGRLLVLTGRGTLFAVDPERPSLETTRALDLPPPLDVDAFAVDAGPAVNPGRFRALDLAVRAEPDGTGWTLFVSHERWSPEARCVTIAVSRAGLTPELGPAAEGWATVYATRPCLSLDGSLLGDFAGHRSGGRLAWLDGDLLLTTGDFALAGRPQDPDDDYGKTLRLDPDRPDTARLFSLGHRNPQGLTVDSAGRPWSTEHGPRGGDELNRLREGANYGWPVATLGTAYGRMTWEVPEGRAGEPTSPDDAFASPAYAWVPSVGISNLLFLRGDGFPRWRDDLLIGSLRGRSLLRVELDDARVVAVERIPVGVVVRDLVEDARGRLWLRTDGTRIVRVQADPEAESTVGSCSGCHALVEGWDGIGPSLAGIVGRPIGVADFDYSPALGRLRGRWTRKRLDAFLRDPREFAPGTTMEMEGIADPERRARIIDYLASLDGG